MAGLGKGIYFVFVLPPLYYSWTLLRPWPSHAPLGIAWTSDPRNGLIQPGRSHGMMGGIINTLLQSVS